jgi:Bacteriophage head to tail connecting protein
MAKQAADQTPAPAPTRDQKLLQEIKGNLDALEKRRQPYEATWDELFQMFLPRLSLTTEGKESEGEKRTKNIVDMKPQRCRRIASAGYQGWMFPRGQVWARLGFESDEVSQLPDARKYCQQLERCGYAELRKGGFYTAGASWVDIALTMGTGPLYVGENDAKTRCTYLSMHPKECYVAFGADGKPDTLYRKYEMTGRQILQAWPKARIAEAIKTKLQDSAYEKQKMIWAVGPRSDRVYGMFDALNMPFYSVYILEDESAVLNEGGYEAFPFVIWRPQMMTDEDYGRSQGWDTLTTAKRLQAVAKSSTKGSQLAIQSPLNVPSEMMDSLDLTPWGPNPYKSDVRKITPVLTGIDVKPAMTLEEKLHEQLDDGWDVPFFMMMMAMSGKADRTATEVYETAGERSVLMGPTVGSLEDCLLEVWDLTLMYAAKAGRAPRIPENLQKMKGANLKADLVGPLSMLQKRYHGQQATIQTLAQASIILKIDGNAKYVVNGEKTMRRFLEAGGFDAECINDDKRIAELKQADAAAQKAAMSMQLLESLGKAGLGKTLGGANPQEAAGGQ